MANPRLQRCLNWLPAALAVCMIAIESTATMSAENTSRWLLPVWIRLFGPITAAHWEAIHHYIRKTGHFTGYGLVSLCFFYGWLKTLRTANRNWRDLRLRSATFALGCTVLVASADEFHQTFLPGRTGRIFDVGIDTCGAITALILLFFLMPLFRDVRGRPLSIPLAAEIE
jgi:VanZ family protein